MNIRSSFILILFLAGMLSGCSERFRHSVQQVPAPPTIATSPDYTDSTITIAAGAHYDRSPLHTFFYGKHYRPAWITPVQVKVLDIGTARGGLTPLELGGSRQTISLRLENPAGTEYVLRSIDKEPASILPEKWQNSYIANIIRDANTATHPYGAFVIPAMAAAVGVYHTKPELVYVPHDPRLGKYMAAIGGTMALLERRPTGNQTDNPQMGNAPDVKSTRSALEERLADNDSRFDARFYLRARLLDMLLGDWSRHEDNWRWAEFRNQDKGYTYRAIPRDRDNAFYKIKDGPVPWLFLQLGFKPQYQTFQRKITRENLEGLNSSGRNLDELILAALSRQDWIEIADSVKNQLTDAVIENAFKAMPDTVYELSAAPMIAKLKSRRDQLVQIALTYYSMLAPQINITGSDEHERFQIEVLSPEQVHVLEYRIENDGNDALLLLDRTFSKTETDELNLYGLGGDDEFIVKGRLTSAIGINIWGGAGEDIYRVQENGSKLGKRIRITDSRYSNTFRVGAYTSVVIDDELPAKKFDAAGWILRYYLD
ncbi:hypothetical protein I2I11_03580 [Pontibacter sp. 172403-2]|uniref:hypothetical protein n=1 Tax=Pontibacter rufus TaxID=2791028 RepID=UPI0018AF5A9B|nr:hypothetical protein [Pontibacter sp. 172403-2]MBF9252365.1 hypothetical protein [Pontibacter sp. 172403-2]